MIEGSNENERDEDGNREGREMKVDVGERRLNVIPSSVFRDDEWRIIFANDDMGENDFSSVPPFL